MNEIAGMPAKQFRGHEERDADIRGAVGFAVALTATVIIVLFLMKWMLHTLTPPSTEMAAPVSTFSPTRLIQTGPRLQVHGPQDLKNLRAREDAILHNYGWIDREKGIVRIPIERAMELLVQKGASHSKPMSSKPSVK